MKRALLFMALLAFAVSSSGEIQIQKLSVTATSQTFPLNRNADAIGLCSYGANIAYYRVFFEDETTAAATTASSELPAGSATAPYCISFGKTPTQHRGNQDEDSKIGSQKA